MWCCRNELASLKIEQDTIVISGVIKTGSTAVRAGYRGIYYSTALPVSPSCMIDSEQLATPGANGNPSSGDGTDPLRMGRPGEMERCQTAGEYQPEPVTTIPWRTLRKTPGCGNSWGAGTGTAPPLLPLHTWVCRRSTDRFSPSVGRRYGIWFLAAHHKYMNNQFPACTGNPISTSTRRVIGKKQNVPE